jgi:hypothetical protein
LDIGRSLTMARYYNLSLRSTKRHNQTTLDRTNGGKQCFFFDISFAILQRERAPQHHQRLLEKFQIKFQKKTMKSPKKLADFDKILAFFLKNCHIKIVGSSK